MDWREIYVNDSRKSQKLKEKKQQQKEKEFPSFVYRFHFWNKSSNLSFAVARESKQFVSKADLKCLDKRKCDK